MGAEGKKERKEKGRRRGGTDKEAGRVAGVR